MGIRHVTLIACLALLVGCLAPVKRRPLFGGEPEPSLGSNLPKPPPPRNQRLSDTERLLLSLRDANSIRRREIVHELIRRGELVRPHVERARTSELVLLDVLDELLAQLGEKEPAKPPEPLGLTGRVPVSDWVRKKYRLAQDRYLGGNIYGAIQVIDAIVALEPDTALRPKLRRLRTACAERLLRESVFKADINTSRKVLLPGHPLTVKITLKNLSEQRVTLHVSDDLRLGTLNLDYEELSPDGAHTRTRVQRPIRTKRDTIVLNPGQRTAITLNLPTPHRRLPAGLVGRYHLSGRLRAQTMLVGETSYPMFVPLGTSSIVALTPGDWELTRSTPARFAEAVIEAKTGALRTRVEPARQAFVASILMAQEDREATVETLAMALEGATGPLSDTLCAALARATGEPLNFTRQEWLIWWKGRQSRPTKDRSSRE